MHSWAKLWTMPTNWQKKEPEIIIIEMTAEELIGICPSVVDYNENYTVQSLEISKMIEEKMQNILNGTGDNLMLKIVKAVNTMKMRTILHFTETE